MYTDTYENAPSDQFGHPNQYNQTPQYNPADQFISSPLPQITPLQDQEMLLHDPPQDPNLFQIPPENQITFQDEHMPPATLDEPMVPQHIPPAVMNEQAPQDRPETPGGNVRITRSRLRGM